MWKYMDQNQSQEFLLSLHLLHNQLSDKEKVKMLYSISNSIEENYNIIKIKIPRDSYFKKKCVYNSAKPSITSNTQMLFLIINFSFYC